MDKKTKFGNLNGSTSLGQKTRSNVIDKEKNIYQIMIIIQMNQRTRKLMTMHKVLHPRDDVDRLYVTRKEGGRGLTSIEDSIDASI